MSKRSTSASKKRKARPTSLNLELIEATAKKPRIEPPSDPSPTYSFLSLSLPIVLFNIFLAIRPPRPNTPPPHPSTRLPLPSTHLPRPSIRLPRPSTRLLLLGMWFLSFAK